MKLTGVVQEGKGEGAKFISLPTYDKIFTKLLGSQPFPGTLNVKISEEDGRVVTELFNKKGQRFEELYFQNKKMGDIIVIPCEIGGLSNHKSVIVRPLLTTHHIDIIEIVSSAHIRDILNLKDQDQITVVV